jgi:hypothetical protein
MDPQVFAAIVSAFDIVVLPFGLRAQKLGGRPTLISFAIEFLLGIFRVKGFFVLW